MEEIVEVLVDTLLAGPEYQTFCKCKKCRNDVVALSLNSIPPQYATTQQNRERVYESYNQPDMRKWVNKRIIGALHVVNKYPKHNI